MLKTFCPPLFYLQINGGPLSETLSEAPCVLTSSYPDNRTQCNKEELGRVGGGKIVWVAAKVPDCQPFPPPFFLSLAFKSWAFLLVGNEWWTEEKTYHDKRIWFSYKKVVYLTKDFIIVSQNCDFPSHMPSCNFLLNFIERSGCNWCRLEDKWNRVLSHIKSSAQPFAFTDTEYFKFSWRSFIDFAYILHTHMGGYSFYPRSKFLFKKRTQNKLLLLVKLTAVVRSTTSFFTPRQWGRLVVRWWYWTAIVARYCVGNLLCYDMYV